MAFKKSDNPRTARIEFRCTPDEKEQIERNAQDCIMPVSDYMLRVALARQTRTQHDLNLVNDLRGVADLLRELYAGAKPRQADELTPVLNAVVAAIDRIGMESRVKL